MKTRNVLFVLISFVFVTGSPFVTANETEVELSESNFERIKRYIMPSSRELSFLKLGWRPTFWEAVKEARKKKKPVFLWAMNGHPLGHT